MAAKPGQIHRQMAALLQQHPEGLTSGQLREKLGLGASEQAQFDRRRRDLKKRPHGRDVVYIFKGTRDSPLQAEGINARVRSAILGRAHGRCQMCGRTIADYGIVLVVDHQIPRDWGGSNEEENLWAICEKCYLGKQLNFRDRRSAIRWLATRKSSAIDRVTSLAEARAGELIPAPELKAVVGASDWARCVRELRTRGWQVEVLRTCRSRPMKKFCYMFIRS